MVLSCCNGAGGGDYYALNNEDVGCWITDSNNISFSDELKKGYTDSRLLFNEFSKKENNIDIIIDYIKENFKVSDIGKIENMKFSPSLFLDKNEEKCIIEKSIRKIINKQIDLKNKVRDKDKDAQDIKDLVANYEEELEK